MMPPLTKKQIAGKYLKKLIIDCGITQEKFSYEFHLELRTVSRYINEGISKVDVIQELAEYFNVRFEDFFNEDNIL